LERYFGTAHTVLAWWVVHRPCQVLCWLAEMNTELITNDWGAWIRGPMVQSSGT
jgi:hypothetical protein